MWCCPVCHDEEERPTLTLPGCGHRFHAACILTAAQYDARCPVCRAAPTGVDLRAPETPVTQTILNVTVSDLEQNGLSLAHLLDAPMTDESDTYVLGTLHAEASRADEDEDARYHVWTRYRARRRRCLNRHPHLLRMYDALKDVRAAWERASRAAEREHARLCREAWRTDPTVRAYAREAARLRRKELRLDRALHAALHEHLGSEPR